MNELSPEAHQALEGAVQLAVQRHQAGDLSGAEVLYGKVLSLHAHHAVALHNLALILLDRDDVAAALELLTAAVREKPLEPIFHFNRAVALQRVSRYGDAAAAYRNALQLKPDYREAWENLGVVLQEQERLDDALDSYTRALRIERCSPVARKNIGNVLRVMGRLDEAEQHYREALDCNPLNSEVAVQYGATLLSKGDYAGAWHWYEWRYWDPASLAVSPPCRIPLPKWNGAPLGEGKLLLYGEQGIGDEIMFASCLVDAASQAGSTVLLCAARLAPLFARSFPSLTVLPRAAGALTVLPEAAAQCDVRMSLAGLPRYFRNTVESFPGEPYLRADEGVVTQWRQRLAQTPGRIKVGLSWHGGAARRAQEARSVALERLAPLFAHPDIDFINVQYGEHREEIARLNATLLRPLICYDEIDPLQDMDGFAALLSALDLVITVDNSTAHLAGALGVPTWLLLPAHADWRWARQREDTPWYRTVRLFWQSAPGHEAWTGVINRVVAELAQAAPRTLISEHAVTVPDVIPIVIMPDAPRALLLNDTAYWYHWGCTCTSIALHEGLRGEGYMVDSVPITEINAMQPLPACADEFDDDGLFETFRARNPALIARMAGAATVVINGEGSIHDLGQTAVALLYCAYVAKRRLGKDTRIVNHSCFPSTGGTPSEQAEALYRKVYRALDFVAVREEHSAEILGRLGVDAVQSFDCLPLFVRHHSPVGQADDTRRVVLAGSVRLTQALLDMLVDIAGEVMRQGYEVQVLVGANAYLAQDDVQFAAALHQRLRGRYTLVAATSEAEWLGIIAGADLLVSGRFHHSIAAACLGTPLVVTASNTAKIDGLLRRLDLPAERVWIDPAEPRQATDRVSAMLREPQRGRLAPAALASLRELALRNFPGLASRPDPFRA